MDKTYLDLKRKNKYDYNDNLLSRKDRRNKSEEPLYNKKVASIMVNLNKVNESMENDCQTKIGKILNYYKRPILEKKSKILEKVNLTFNKELYEDIDGYNSLEKEKESDEEENEKKIKKKNKEKK